jgi:hypothetical protein
MSLVFPSSPNVGDLFQDRWQWDGDKWDVAPPQGGGGPSAPWTLIQSAAAGGQTPFSVTWNYAPYTQGMLVFNGVLPNAAGQPQLSFSVDGTTYTTPITIGASTSNATTYGILTFNGLRTGTVFLMNPVFTTGTPYASLSSSNSGYAGHCIVGSPVQNVRFSMLSNTMLGGTISAYGK